MWYPSKKRVDELSRVLKGYELEAEIQLADISAFLQQISARVRDMATSGCVPEHHLRDWIWIGSQFRIHGKVGGDAGRIAGRALVYLLRTVRVSVTHAADSLSEIRWVRNSTVGELRSILGRESIRMFLSPDEVRRVEELWRRLQDAGPSAGELERSVQPYMEKFTELESPTYLPGIARLIATLLDVSGSSHRHASVAAGALRYLVRERDVVPDSLGYLGLVDDIHVLESAYQIVGEEAAWAPVLDRFLLDWPLIDDLVIEDGSGPQKISTLLQMVCAATLHCLLQDSNRKQCLVLPDPGPAAAIAALAATFFSLTEQSDTQRRALDSLEYGDHVILADSKSVFKAQYLSREETDRVLHWLLLARDSRIGLPEQTAGLLRRSPKQHKRLSSHAQYMRWKQSYSPSPLGHLVGRDVNLDTIRPDVLLLMRRNRLDRLVRELRPLGKPIPELVGLRYVSKTGSVSDLGQTTLKRPLLWACSDPAVACSIERGEVEGFRPRFVVADSAELASGLTFSHEGPPTVVVAGQHEWEAIESIMQAGYPRWYLRRRDVRPTSVGRPRRIEQGGGLLSRYMARQAIRAVAEFEFHEIRNQPLESLAECHRDLRRLSRDEPGFEELALLAALLVRAVQDCVLEPTNEEIAEFRRLAKQAARRASGFRHFDPVAQSLYELTARYRDDGQVYVGREVAIRDVLDRESGSAAILCGSRRRAKQSARRARGDSVLSRARWIDANTLRDEAPFDVLIVAGWRNRALMRAVRVGGYALRCHYVLFPFERAWEDRSRGATIARQQSLERENVGRWESLPELYKSGVRRPPTPPPSPGPEKFEQPEEQDDTVSEWLERRMAERIWRSYAGRTHADVVRARLVLFEDPDYFALLPPQGRVIDLTGVVDGYDASALSSDDSAAAERLINRPVSEIRRGSLLAFPVGATSQLLDELADRLIADPQHQRQLAGLWHRAIREFYEACKRDVSLVRLRLRDGGVDRAESTILQWIHTPQAIAPRGWPETLARIADVTGSEDLRSNFDQVVEAVDLLYRARRDAAARLVRRLAEGEVDHEAGILSLDIEGHAIRYRVLRVRSIDAPREVPFDQVGWLHREPFSGSETP